MSDFESGSGRPPDDEEPIVVQEEVVVSGREAHQLDREAGWAAHNWGWLLGLGAIGVVFGIVLLSHAFGSLSALVWLTGLFLVFIGVAQLMTMGRGGARSQHVTGAVIAIIGGIILLVWPGETLKVVAVVAGITVLVWGIVRTATAFGGSHETRTSDLVVGIALIVLGVIMMAWPSATITLIGVIAGLIAVVWGVLTIVASFRLRAAGRRWEELHERSRVAH